MDKIEGKIVLVVDDESEIRQQLQELLLKEGYEVLQASDGEEALSVLEKSLPDLIILDIIMPKIDGVKVLKKARETYPEIDQSVIFYTQLLESDTVTSVLHGSSAYFAKSECSISELVLHINDRLGSK